MLMSSYCVCVPISSVSLCCAARTAQHAWEKSCYYNIDFMIAHDAKVYDAIQRMSAYNVGCLCVTTDGKVTGIISERDYVCKIALFGRNSKETLVKVGD
jgi:predicted transcriptional regulator